MKLRRPCFLYSDGVRYPTESAYCWTARNTSIYRLENTCTNLRNSPGRLSSETSAPTSPPPLAGAIPPGTVHLFNTMDELDKLYARVAQELDERDSPNTRMGQRLVAWLNRYLGDTDRMMRAKPSKHHVVSHTLTKWRPPAWITSRGKNKHEEYRKAHQAVLMVCVRNMALHPRPCPSSPRCSNPLSPQFRPPSSRRCSPLPPLCRQQHPQRFAPDCLG